jgi:hypothetical protein
MKDTDETVRYLGDGVYASFDGYQICLMANSHTTPTDRVYLEPSVCQAFLDYVHMVGMKI